MGVGPGVGGRREGVLVLGVEEAGIGLWIEILYYVGFSSGFCTVGELSQPRVGLIMASNGELFWVLESSLYD